MGGLHRFMSWERAILTDSGGFQVFSLMICGGERGGREVSLASGLKTWNPPESVRIARPTT